ncbi:MAG: two-component system, NtrC family, nitrogen regulation sensor histidine kinase NtrY [Thermoanaerobaculia bacterium]|jgi:nitrogen fixation/metabolism regulation signal transduction histidine kinase|nr:two-component system, NtrC family, nitrogen regulation sensor histidine kinase NtrY [Thermoanaerobaculia bacterium]
MTLRTKLLLWFIVLHLVFAGLAVVVLMEHQNWLFAVEVTFVISILISYRMVNALFVPMELIRTGAELISERDFTSRFVPIGQPEMDRLIEIYNAMIDRLRDERLAAEEQQQLLQKIVEASPSGIVICDFQGDIQQANPAAQRLLSEPAVAEALSALARGESKLVTLAGARKLKIWNAEFRDRGFAKTFYLLEEMTEELRLTEKTAYEKLIRMMSHEVNNSVGAVRSLLESVLRYAEQIGPDDRADFTNALTIAAARIESLNRFMSGFADVVRLPPPHPRDVALAAVIDDIATLLRPELDQRRIALRLDVEKDATIRVDQSQFEQVIINVIRNAMESIGEEGEIAVSFRDDALTVADTGRGIDPAARDELFTPFFTTKREGRGLGLTIVSEILNNHHLPFTLQNREGGGAEFRVTFT